MYDYGLAGCGVRDNLLAVWSQYFIVERDMLELEAPCPTPAPVLEANDDVDKFSGLMAKDVETGDCYMADHLLKEYLDWLI